jgi:hypothetical protein
MRSLAYEGSALSHEGSASLTRSTAFFPGDYRGSGLVQRDIMEYPVGITRITPALMPANFTTLPHFSVYWTM